MRSQGIQHCQGHGSQPVCGIQALGFVLLLLGSQHCSQDCPALGRHSSAPFSSQVIMTSAASCYEPLFQLMSNTGKLSNYSSIWGRHSLLCGLHVSSRWTLPPTSVLSVTQLRVPSVPSGQPFSSLQPGLALSSQRKGGTVQVIKALSSPQKFPLLSFGFQQGPLLQGPISSTSAGSTAVQWLWGWTKEQWDCDRFHSVCRTHSHTLHFTWLNCRGFQPI